MREFGKRAAMNTPVQGTAADIIKLAMVRVDEALRREGLKSRLILQVHDELLLECPPEEVEKAGKLLKDAMEHVIERACRCWRKCIREQIGRKQNKDRGKGKRG